jgi:hypothetical protein
MNLASDPSGRSQNNHLGIAEDLDQLCRERDIAYNYRWHTSSTADKEYSPTLRQMATMPYNPKPVGAPSARSPRLAIPYQDGVI